MRTYEDNLQAEREQTVEDLREIQRQMLELLGQARNILDGSSFESAAAQAACYWIPHIEMNLSNEHDYCGGTMCSLEDTITEIEEGGE